MINSLILKYFLVENFKSGLRYLDTVKNAYLSFCKPYLTMKVLNIELSTVKIVCQILCAE